MRILIVGSGGREHALARNLGRQHEVFACSGNDGMSGEAICLAGDPIAVSRGLHPDLVVIGPEDPLIAGLADALRAQGFSVFGPGAEAARLEGSKAFAKAAMSRAGVPTAEYRTFTSPAFALDYARSIYGSGSALAIKASGNALGKGVVVAADLEEASEAIARLSSIEAGSTLVLEERLVGWESSLLTLVSERSVLSLPLVKDHKRLLDGDLGPNTGGMGTIAPHPDATAEISSLAEDKLVRPLLHQLGAEGISFRGMLFSGVMHTAKGPMALEYNVRFGDPETQSLLPLVSGDLGQALLECANGEEITPLELRSQCAATIVLAAPGYPDSPRKGDAITVGPLPEGVHLNWAGAQSRDAELRTAGGRIVGVTGVAETAKAASDLAYEGVNSVQFDGRQFRADIGR